MSVKKLKPVKCWANFYPKGTPYLHKTNAEAISIAGCSCQHSAVPVVVIPLDDVEGLVNKAALAATNEARKLFNKPAVSHISHSEGPVNNMNITAVALRAIGIPVKKGGRK